MIPVLERATPATRVVLLQAPYPGRLKFDGQPSSLLHAVSVFSRRLAAEGRLSELGWLDPGVPSDAYREELATVIKSPAVRALLISTTNAAVEEMMYAVRLARELRGPELLVLVGGPHEDDCDVKAASCVEGIDLSIGGDAEYVVDSLLSAYLEQKSSPSAFCSWAFQALPEARLRGSRVVVTSRRQGSLTLELPPIRPTDLVPPAWTTKRVKFSVFEAPETLPVLVSRGCSYGKCTFCAEPNQAGARVVMEDFEWLGELVGMRPDAAVYFQDSIFPKTTFTEERLLPLMKELGVEWGAQVYLRTLSRPWLEKLRAHGATYLYTGLESASSEVLAGIGKVNMNGAVALERLGWMRDLGFRAGISLMFGAIGLDGQLLETPETIEATMRLVGEIRALGVQVTGFYPNILTVLSGTQLERALRADGVVLNFFNMPRTTAFEEFEDGAVGWNFASIGMRGWEALAERISTIKT